MTQSVPQPRLAFLGLGLMGKPMAIRLVQAGCALTVWNRTRAKADALATLGAQAAATPNEAVQRADIIISMLETGTVVREVAALCAPKLRSGSLWIDMSSTRQSEATALHELLAAHGVAFVDAPVSGGVAGAEAGSLAIMTGGSAHDFARAEPFLKILGRPTLVGPAGCGQLAKLCNQLIVGGTLNIIAEALLLAQAGGADPAAVRNAIRGGFAESRILDIHGQRMLERNFIPGGQVKSQTKDLENVLLAATAAGIHLPLTELVTDRFRSILSLLPNADHAAALIALERSNPGQRLGDAPDRLPE